MEIKDVDSRDLKKIVNLEQKIFKENAFSEDLMERLIEKNFFFLKLEINKLKKHIIGFIIVIKEKDRKDNVNIVNFLIDSKFQNRGYGSYLLQHVIEKIKNLKIIKKIILNVQLSNTIAITLYEKFNFKRNPLIVENYYHSGKDAYLMELNIYS
ncbi:MAG: GNAT family N-acetyltransferase [Candidatus Lokiarchaeota archaeon]|nr:GNAT family N-acetyltransferase [Candidatus Lokiarchaeota archaeon]